MIEFDKMPFENLDKQSNLRLARIKAFSKSALIDSTYYAIKTETSATTNVVLHLKEIFERELYLEFGFSSMFEMATELFGYSAPAAQSRINAMKLLLTLPELEEKIESGELNLTTASMAQSFFQAEERANKKISPEQKLELLEKLETKSTREVKQQLASLNPKSANHDSYKFIDADHVEMKITISRTAFEKLERLKAVRSHADPNPGFGQLIEWLAQLGLEKIDPVKKIERQELRLEKKTAKVAGKPSIGKNEFTEESSQMSELTKASDFDALVLQAPEVTARQRETSGEVDAGPRTRYIIAKTKYIVAKQNNHQGCAYVNKITGKRCGSHYFLQLDHYVKPYSEGGPHTPENLRHLCAKHNRWSYRNRCRERTRAYA